jgi:hypothetical protein
MVVGLLTLGMSLIAIGVAFIALLASRFNTQIQQCEGRILLAIEKLMDFDIASKEGISSVVIDLMKSPSYNPKQPCACSDSAKLLHCITLLQEEKKIYEKRYLWAFCLILGLLVSFIVILFIRIKY